jgi:hypothetical protein
MEMCQNPIHRFYWMAKILLIINNNEYWNNVKCHMSSYNWPPKLNMCQNLIQILLDGQDVINLLIDDEYWNKV